MSSLFVSPRLFSMRALLPASMPKPYPAILKSFQASLTSQQPQALRLIHGATIITLYARLCRDEWRYTYLWSTGGGIGVGIHVDVGSGDESHVASTCLREGVRSGYAHPPFLRFRERRWAGVRRRRCRGMRGYIRKDELYHY
ncbi:hypothetical protein B0H11DRAFT_2018814 [Mycena galericulata]|nr:hypothetical protein B0H11DRAFT_2018814 [Mycena galericulata]